MPSTLTATRGSVTVAGVTRTFTSVGTARRAMPNH